MVIPLRLLTPINLWLLENVLSAYYYYIHYPRAGNARVISLYYF